MKPVRVKNGRQVVAVAAVVEAVAVTAIGDKVASLAPQWRRLFL
ncbi:MAG TPA: hypothetical protein VKY92_17015 [Verrucomicrobiae bacterium]|nr:hypothetical protein [Verrucomicrobiae bacterium]